MYVCATQQPLKTIQLQKSEYRSCIPMLDFNPVQIHITKRHAHTHNWYTLMMTGDWVELQNF